MKRIIELDEEDIKKLISEKYGVNPKDIEWDCEKPDPYDYRDAGFVIFKFEDVKNDGNVER